jgi:hypothetical protein
MDRLIVLFPIKNFVTLHHGGIRGWKVTGFNGCFVWRSLDQDPPNSSSAPHTVQRAIFPFPPS